MLRRRIFSSAMASVMALTSIAVVANAEETINQYKTKADLEAIVAEYGSDAYLNSEAAKKYYSDDDFRLLNEALAYGNAMIADAAATFDDYTVAWRMINSCIKYHVDDKVCCGLVSSQTQFTDNMEDLLEEAKAVLDTNNIRKESEAIQDRKYDATKFAALRSTYNTMYGMYAGMIVTANNGESGADFLNEIYENYATDATNDAKAIDADCHAFRKVLNELYASELTAITKEMFRDAVKEYQYQLQQEFKYETWRRNSTWWSNPLTRQTFGDAFAALVAADNAKADPEDETAVKPISDKLEEFLNFENITSTTKEDIVAAYKACVNATAAFKAWTPDNVTAYTKIAVMKKLNEYAKQFAYVYAQTSAEELYAAIEDVTTVTTVSTPAWNVYIESTTGKIGYNEYKVLVDADVYVPVDKDGKWTGHEVSPVFIKNDEIPEDMKLAGVENYQRIAKTIAFDIANILKAPIIEEPEEIFVDDDTDAPALDYAYWLANYYINVDTAQNEIYDIDDTIDTTAKIKKDQVGSGAAAEWDIVYRFLSYAIADNFVGGELAGDSIAAQDLYSMRQIEALLEKCYALLKETADAKIFSACADNLTKACEEAQEWIANAKSDPDYQNYKGGVGADGAYMDSTTVYKTLYAEYKKLVDEEAALSLKFEEIYDAIARVSEAIDNGDVAYSAAIDEALNKAAYWLNATPLYIEYTLDEKGLDKADDKYYDNAPFNSLKEVFYGHNRVITLNKPSQYIMSLQGYIYADADSSATDTVPNLNDQHDELQAAYNTLLNLETLGTVPEFDLGDVTMNGTVDALDALAVLEHAAGIKALSEDALAYADVDGNGAPATALDALEILKIAAGI